MLISDGTGSKRLLKINEQNRAEVFSISEPRVADISKRTGKSFIIASDFIALNTTASFNGILYIKNSDKDDLYISRIRVCSDTAGANLKIRLIANPTTGTLISDGNVADVNSANLGSSEVFIGNAYSASGDGKTVTDGVQFSQFTNHGLGHSIQEYEGAIVLPKGSSMALVAKPSASLEICSEIQCWFE